MQYNFDRKCAILLQNAFPTLEKYIDHVHTVYGKPAKIPKALERNIINKFHDLLEMKDRGINLFFTDIDKLKVQMLQELEQKNEYIVN